MDIKSRKGTITQNDLKLNNQQAVISGKQKIVDQLIGKKAAIQ